MSSYPPLPPNFDAGDLAALQMENIELKSALRRLVDALPKCDRSDLGCHRTATKTRGPGRWCDEHGYDQFGSPPDYTRAAPLREAIALLERHGGGPASPEAAKCLCTASCGWWECPIHARHAEE